MLLLSCWYKPSEMSKRIALFYTASLMSGAFGGILAGVVSQNSRQARYIHIRMLIPLQIIDGMEGLGNTRGWKWLV